MALTHRAMLILEQVKVDKAAFLASSANLYYVCEKSDPAVAEDYAFLKSKDIPAKQHEGRLYIAKSLNGPDDVFRLEPQLPTVTDLPAVLAYGRSMGWWK